MVDPERIREVADHVARTVRHGNDVVVVVSAMGKETDELIRLAGDVSEVWPGREMDMLITAGERKAKGLLCMALHLIGVPADSFTGSQAGFITDTNHSNAKIVELRLRPAAQGGRRRPGAGGGRCPGVSTDHDVTVPGAGRLRHHGGRPVPRSAATPASATPTCPGCSPPTPGWCLVARRLAAISFDEMLEMTATGCPAGHAVGGVRPALGRGAARPLGLHLGAVHLVTEEDKPTWSRRSFRRHPRRERGQGDGGGARPARIAARLFRELADVDVNVDMIVQNVSEHGVTDISFTVPRSDLASGEPRRRRLADEIGAAGVSSDRTSPG